MTLTIRRTEDREYRLEDDSGDVIEIYQQTRMEHPSDWMPDAEAAGYQISGPYGWEYIDERDGEIDNN